MQKVHVFFVHQKSIMTMFSHEFIFYYLYVHLNKVLQNFRQHIRLRQLQNINCQEIQKNNKTTS
jgi:hypothetical protein